MGIWDQRTKFVNKTGLRIDFVVEDGTICPLRGLPAGKSRSVSLSLIRKNCWERGSADWLIRVLVNNHFCGIHLHPRHHILMMTRIVFKYDWGLDGSSTLIAEGVEENVCDRIFGCCIKLLTTLLFPFSYRNYYILLFGQIYQEIRFDLLLYFFLF